MTANSVLATYAFSGLLIAVYAAGRFDTPASNRSSTRQTLYRWSRAGYVLSALALFAALSGLLQAAAWRTALLGPADAPSLPAPLIATLAMTTLLPTIPVLKRLDAWLLALFLDWAEIPAEVKRRTAAMTLDGFSVGAEDVAALRNTYRGDGGDTVLRHLRARGGEGLALAEFRLTRLIKLHDHLHRLAGKPGYSRFFAEAADELCEIDQRVGEFLRHAAGFCALAERMPEITQEPIFRELLHERGDMFARDCRKIFDGLALFLARAVLRSEAGEAGIVRSLREAGFAAAERIIRPRFPIDSLTLLTLGMFLYLAVLIFLLGDVVGMPHNGRSGLTVAAKAALVRPATIGVSLWLMQRYRFFRRTAGETPRFFAYAVNGAAATAAAAAICAVLHVADSDPLTGLGSDLPLILLTFPLCATLALCCDDWIDNTTPPRWLRLAEAAGCGAAMAGGMGMVLLYLADKLPFAAAGLPGWKLAMVVGFPAAIAAAIGGFVPHVFRAARRATAARHAEAAPPVESAAEQRRGGSRRTVTAVPHPAVAGDTGGADTPHPTPARPSGAAWRLRARSAATQRIGDAAKPLGGVE